MKKMDLSADLAEGFPYDEELLHIITSASICAGAHAGNHELTRITWSRCQELGVRCGLHIGYADRENMGRLALDLANEEVFRNTEQSLIGQCEEFGELKWDYLKPHGAFYHQSMAAAAPILASILKQIKIPLFGSASLHRAVADSAGVHLIREGFADRKMNADGTLVDRSEPGAVLHHPDACATNALEQAPFVDSICVHSDTTDCILIAAKVRQTLEQAGYEVTAQ